MKAHIIYDEWYPWFEIYDEPHFLGHEVDIPEELYNKIKELRMAVCEYDQLLRQLHPHFKDDN